MVWFVHESSVVRKIWGKSDTILFIFAGAAAEFALNKAVDWLFFTGRLPADPLGRLFSTVTYARQIVFSSQEQANHVIDRMADIHHEVEKNRKSKIPPWAYRDVLYMLIDYSIRSSELLCKKKLSDGELHEVYDVFRRVGQRMGIPDLPENYLSWLPDRRKHMVNNLEVSSYTHALFKQYRKHLGIIRFKILLAAQGVIVPEHVRQLLGLSSATIFRNVITIYKYFVRLRMDWYLKKLILPRKYVKQIKALDTASV